MIAEEVIKVLSSKLKKQFDDFKGIYLFGQFLDGKNHEGEDIEMVALFDAEDKSKREEIWPIVGKIETEMNLSSKRKIVFNLYQMYTIKVQLI